MRKYAFSIVLALMLVALPAAADEIVYLVNGSVMPCLSHWVEDGMIYVELSGSGVMAFPEQLVERIDTDVEVRARTGEAAIRGRMAKGDRGTSTGRPTPAQRKADAGRQIDKNRSINQTPTQLAQERAKRRRQPVPVQPGRVAVPQGRQLQGATKRGDRYVIESNQNPKPKGVAFQAKPDPRHVKNQKKK